MLGLNYGWLKQLELQVEIEANVLKQRKAETMRKEMNDFEAGDTVVFTDNSALIRVDKFNTQTENFVKLNTHFVVLPHPAPVFLKGYYDSIPVHNVYVQRKGTNEVYLHSKAMMKKVVIRRAMTQAHIESILGYDIHIVK